MYLGGRSALRDATRMMQNDSSSTLIALPFLYVYEQGKWDLLYIQLIDFKLITRSRQYTMGFAAEAYSSVSSHTSSEYLASLCAVLLGLLCFVYSTRRDKNGSPTVKILLGRLVA